jgi:formiminotetrahydrofolate cyclodeaminase
MSRNQSIVSSISEQSVGSLLAAVAGGEPTPGGGAVSGVVGALAAALAAMAGRFAQRRVPESAVFVELVDRADALCSRARTLADEDVAAYTRYVDAAAVPREPDPSVRRSAIRAALDAAADVPAELADVAGDIADIGRFLACSGNPNLRSDACAAALLGSAVAISAAALVKENLRDRLDDPRVAAAADRACRAAEAAAKALELAGLEPSNRITT